jgi:Uma2 family endonuclease
MGMPAQEMVWTAEMARALPEDGKRYEVLDGELFVTPAPTGYHQRALRLLFEALSEYVGRYDIGELFWSPADIEFSTTRLLQPDLFIIPPGAFKGSWRDITSLVLAIEVLSPSTARADRHRKRVIYQSEGVPEYWIVDLDARLIERWRPDDVRPEILTESMTWQPISGADPLIVDLTRLFQNVLA